MRAWILALAALFAVGSCGGAQTPAEPVPDPGRDVTRTIADAVKLIRARRLDAAEKLLADARLSAAAEPRLLEQVDYYIATVLVYRGKVDRALRLITDHERSAALRGDADSEAWMTSSRTWLNWSKGDLDAALAANERLAEVTASDLMDRTDRRAWMLQHLWDRAFLRCEVAAYAPAAERAGPMEGAREAVQDHAALAGADDEEDAHALEAWLAWRSGQTAAAMAAISGIAIDDHSDPRRLFVIAVIADAGGDRVRAEKARAELAGMVNLVVPLMLQARPHP